MIDSSVAPEGRFNSPMIWSAFVERALPSGASELLVGRHGDLRCNPLGTACVLLDSTFRTAFQMRRTAVLRSVNLSTGFTPGKPFDIPSNLAVGQLAVSLASCRSLTNASRPPDRTFFWSISEQTCSLPLSMRNIFARRASRLEPSAVEHSPRARMNAIGTA